MHELEMDDCTSEPNQTHPRFIENKITSATISIHKNQGFDTLYKEHTEARTFINPQRKEKLERMD